MSLLYVLVVVVAVLALLTAAAALVMVVLANRRARAVEECSVFRDVQLRTDLTALEGRVNELRYATQSAGERSTVAYEAARAFRRGRRITDPVVDPPPLPPLPKTEPI